MALKDSYCLMAIFLLILCSLNKLIIFQSFILFFILAQHFYSSSG